MGSRVTLRSLFPETIVTVRVSGFHPEFGIDTTTMWSPTVRLALIGVVLPVSAPSMVTFAPAGNDVTLSAPPPFCAATDATAAAMHTAVVRKDSLLFIAA